LHSLAMTRAAPYNPHRRSPSPTSCTSGCPHNALSAAVACLCAKNRPRFSLSIFHRWKPQSLPIGRNRRHIARHEPEMLHRGRAGLLPRSHSFSSRPADHQPQAELPLTLGIEGQKSALFTSTCAAARPRLWLMRAISLPFSAASAGHPVYTENIPSPCFPGNGGGTVQLPSAGWIISTVKFVDTGPVDLPRIHCGNLALIRHRQGGIRELLDVRQPKRPGTAARRCSGHL